MLLIASLFKFGKVVSFITSSVITGFTSGGAYIKDKDGNVTINANSNTIAQVSYVDNKVNEIVTALNALLENY